MKAPDNGMKTQMIQCAIRLFATNGYHGTSIADLAREVGLTKGSVYTYFASKSDILFEIYSGLIDEMNQRLDRHPLGLSPEERLRRFVKEVMEFSTADPYASTIFIQETPLLNKWLPPRQVAELRRGEARFVRYAQAIIEDGVATGAFRPTDPETTAFGILGMVLWTNRWYRASRSPALDKVADDFSSMLLKGLSADPAPMAQAAEDFSVAT